MNYTEHIKQAEILLSEAEKDMATAQSQHDWRTVQQMIQMSQAHAQIAQAMGWSRPS